MVSRTCVAAVLGFCLLLAISGVAAAEQGDSLPGESPRVMRIGGVLKDAQGAPRSGAYRVAFSIYAEPEGGGPVWAETQEVSVGGNARYEVLLGSSRPEGFPAELLASGKLLWLGIQVGEEPEQRPRVMLVSVAHALKADDAATLSGKALSELVQVEELKSPEGRKKLGLSPMATTDDVFTATADPGPGFISQALSGPPLQVSSSGKVTDLNVDLFDDLDSTDFAQLATANTFTASQTMNGDLSVGGTLTLPSSVLVQAAGDLFLHNSGTANTFLGVNAGNLTMTGRANTASGFDALNSNSTGSANTASGVQALVSNTTGGANTASGFSALRDNTTGANNTASGFSALQNNTTGADNTASGFRALSSNTTGGSNTATGASALDSNTTGGFTTASGASALANNATGNGNTASGFQALFRNTSGISNTATGVGALGGNTTGDFNIASGTFALVANTTGSRNIATGVQALFGNTTGGSNIAIGDHALQSNTTGGSNIAIGDSAGSSLTTGNFNICVGNAGAPGESNTMRLGIVQTRTFIAGIHNVMIAGGGTVLINSSGQLGTVPSSARFKEEIEDMGKTSSGLLKLRPVTFRYKEQSEGSNPLHFGLIAEEVDKVLPDLVVHTPTGEAETVLYHEMPAMLVNELQKQQRRIEQQEGQISDQQSRIEALEARLAELEGSVRETHASGKQ